MEVTLNVFQLPISYHWITFSMYCKHHAFQLKLSTKPLQTTYVSIGPSKEVLINVNV